MGRHGMRNRRLAPRLQPVHGALRVRLGPLFIIRVVQHAGNTPLLHVLIACAVLARRLAHDDLHGPRMLAQ